MLILCCAVGAELGGPYITKTIIDKHLTRVISEIAPVLMLLGLYMGLLLSRAYGNFTQSYILAIYGAANY